MEVTKSMDRRIEFICFWQALCLFFASLKRAVHFTSAHHIKVTGFEPMALCTQNRCADQTALHLVSPPQHIDPPDRWRLEPNSPILLGIGTREPKKKSNQPLFLENLPPARQDRATPKSRIVQERSHFFLLPLSLEFNKIRLGYLSFGPKARLEVDSNHWHKDFQSFALTSWATWTTFLKSVFFIE